VWISVTSGRRDAARIQFRIPARETQAVLLRAQLRLWLLANEVDDEADVFEIVASASSAFLFALRRPGPLRTIAVEVSARREADVVEIAVRDHAGPGGNTVRFERLLAPQQAAQPVVVN
jgi:hypothetical protein